MTDMWQPAVFPIALPPHVAHVWLIRLDDPGSDIGHLTALLSQDERQRASRWRFAEDRRRFITAHGVLRLLLGTYIGRAAAALRFATQPFGKPLLARHPGDGDIRFNLAHSHAVALVAVMRDREIGVDVEYMKPLDDIALTATHFFSAYERDTLLALPDAAMQRGFYTCWSRKEAVIKALGLGLSQPLDKFDVSLAPGEPAQLLALRGTSHKVADWLLHDLPPLEDYATALATEGECQQIMCHVWPPHA